MIKHIKKFFAFITAGLIGYVTMLAITITLTEVFSFYYLASYIMGLAVNIMINFIFFTNVVFGASDKKYKRFLSYLVVWLGFFFLNIITVKLLSDSLLIDYKVSIIATTFIYMAIKYLVYDKFVFNAPIKKKHL